MQEKAGWGLLYVNIRLLQPEIERIKVSQEKRILLLSLKHRGNIALNIGKRDVRENEH